MKHKLFIIRFSDDLLYLEEFNYDTYEQRYQYTKDIDLSMIFEESELDRAYEILHDWNQ